MSVQADRVSEPFRSDARFWWSLWASLGAVLTLVAASLVAATVGGMSAVSYAVPAVLLVVAAVAARSSSAATRPQFATREQWRDAERDAVASALLLRRRRASSPS